MYKDGIAITIAEGSDHFEQVIIAQTADTLLTMNGVVASFVIAKRNEDNS